MAHKIREENTKSLKQALRKEQGVQVTHRYYIKLPTEEVHHKKPPKAKRAMQPSGFRCQHEHARNTTVLVNILSPLISMRLGEVTL